MNTNQGRSEETALSDALAGLLGHLRGSSDPDLPPGAEEALHEEADRLVGRLAEHLRYTERVLFPLLRESEARPGAHLDGLEVDHRLLHLQARELAVQVRARDRAAAYRASRSFLAVLLDHLHREARGVERLAPFLDDSDARRLRDRGGVQPSSRSP